MQVRVLGSVRVESHGVEVPIPMGKPLALLARLALAQGRAVSAEQLVVALWGDDAAPSAAKTLQVHMSTLRSRIREVGIGVSLTSSGYMLEVDDDEIDVIRFESLAEEGLLAMATGRPELAGRMLRQALQLWSGEPLANVLDAPFAALEASRLMMRRLAVTQARIDADVALGLGAELVDEVRAVVDTNPYDERACGQLMVCLYRAGKPAAALEAHQTLRRVLGDELGLEPGPGLAELERQVLTHDERLLARATNSQRPYALFRNRANLPRIATTFVGGIESLALVTESVARDRLVTLTGAGGVGKTRVAVECAHRLREDFGGAVLFVDLAPMPFS